MLLCLRRDALPHQHIDIALRAAPRRAEQNRNITVLKRTQNSVLCHPETRLCIHELPDPPCDEPGLRFLPRLLRIIRQFREQQLTLIGSAFASLRKVRAGIKRRIRIIADAADRCVHQLLKDSVHAVQKLCSAPEILSEIHTGIAALRRHRRVRSGDVIFPVVSVLLHEELRPCLTEAVNRLLHIAHQKDLAVLNRLKQSLLHTV